MVKTRRYKRIRRSRARSYKKWRTTKVSRKNKSKVGGWGGFKMPEFGGRKERNNNLAAQYSSSLYGGWGEPLVSP